MKDDLLSPAGKLICQRGCQTFRRSMSPLRLGRKCSPLLAVPHPLFPLPNRGVRGTARWCGFGVGFGSWSLGRFWRPPLTAFYNLRLTIYCTWRYSILGRSSRKLISIRVLLRRKRNKTTHTAQYRIPRDALSQTHAHPRTLRNPLNARLS